MELLMDDWIDLRGLQPVAGEGMEWGESTTLTLPYEVAVQMRAVVQNTSEEDCMFFRHEGKLYFVAHGSASGKISIFERMCEPMEILSEILDDPEEAEEVVLISCYVGRMELGRTGSGYNIKPISGEAINEISFKICHSNASTGMATVDLVFM